MNGNSAGILPARLQQTILVIDDDPAMRTILGFTLKAFGYVALVAGDAYLLKPINTRELSGQLTAVAEGGDVVN